MNTYMLNIAAVTVLLCALTVPPLFGQLPADIPPGRAHLVPQVPPPKLGPHLRVLRDSRHVRGDGFLKGTLQLSSKNVYTIKPSSGSDMTLGFGLPDAMSLKQAGNGNAEVRWRRRGRLSGADDEVTVYQDSHMLSGYVWKSGQMESISLPISDGWEITQEEVPLGFAGNGIRRVGVSLIKGDIKKELTLRQESVHEIGGRTYKILVLTSGYRHVTEKSDDVKSGYILKAVVVQQ